MEAAAQTFDGVALGVDVALCHTLYPLGGDVLGNVVIHFDKNEAAVAAVLGILFEDGMAGGAGAREAVENQ